MEVLLVRAAVPFPCPRRSQKSAEAPEPQKVRQSKFLTKDRSTENPTKPSVAAAASNSSMDPQIAPSASVAPHPAFPLRFPWFKGGKKGVASDGTTMAAAAAAACGDVASIALSAAHDGTTSELDAEEKRTVHEVLSTLQSPATELTALEVGGIKSLSPDEAVVDETSGSIGSDELSKAEAQIARSWLHNFMRVKLWNNRQSKTTTKAPRKQSQNGVDQPCTDVSEAESSESPESVDSCDPVLEGGVEAALGCACDECSVDTDSERIPSGVDEVQEIDHIKIVHNQESFSKFLQPVSVGELKALAHLSFLANLAYAIPSIKPSDLLRLHGLRFITSSVHLKAAEEKAALEKAAREKAAQEEAAAKEIARLEELEQSSPSPEAISARPVNVPKHSRVFSLFRNTTVHESEPLPSSLPLMDELCVECQSKLVSPVDTKVSANTSDSPVAPESHEDIVSSISAEAQPLHSCPCDWFICEEELSKTLNLSIKGSDSVASWQANLLFEPTRFEDPKLGVMVHRGIYEAAQALYKEVLPCVLEHLQKYGSEAKFRFTGHSLGGSLAVLLSLMLRVRDTAPLDSLLPVYTFGSPFVLCGGDHLLQQLGLPKDHVQMVVMHRDIVPRSFSCEYPEHVAEVLKRVNGTFRNYSCLKKQRLLYTPMGAMRVVQPPPTQAPGHPFLPPGSGIYDILHPSSSKADESGNSPQESMELRSAQRAFLNNPHPLQILRDRSSYGSGGSISRDHDPRNYDKAVNYLLRQELRKLRKSYKTEKRVQIWWPSLASEIGVELIKGVLTSKIADSEHSANSGSIGAATSGLGANHQELRGCGSLVKSVRSVPSARKTSSGSALDRLRDRKSVV